jgi:hypothetical protein
MNKRCPKCQAPEFTPIRLRRAREAKPESWWGLRPRRPFIPPAIVYECRACSHRATYELGHEPS